MKISKREYKRLKAAEKERDELRGEIVSDLKAKLDAIKREPLVPPPVIPLWTRP